MQLRLIFTLLLSFHLLSVNCQFRITGTVIDAAKKNPIPAVSILLRGTTDGTYTNQEGKFSINSDKDSVTLVLSSIGYKTKTITAKTFDNNYDAGTIELTEIRFEYEKPKLDTIDLKDVLTDSIVIIKTNHVTFNISFKDFIYHFDPMTAPAEVLFHTNELKYCLSYIKTKIKETTRIELGKRFMNDVGFGLIEDFIAEMIDKGSITVYNKANKKQKKIIRNKSGQSGNGWCWYGRKYYLEGKKKEFLVITDIIC